MSDDKIDADELAALREALKDWRTWAQFVWLGGGPVTETDEVLRARICEVADASTAAVKVEYVGFNQVDGTPQ